MEYRFLSHIHFVCQIDDIGKYNSEENLIFPSFEVELLNPESLQKTLKYVYSSNHSGAFTIALNISRSFTFEKRKSYLEDLVLLLSHKDYLKYNNFFVIPVFQELEKNGKQVLDEIKHGLVEQGFNNIIFPDLRLPDEGAGKQIAYTLYNNDLQESLFFQWYKANLMKGDSVMNMFTLYSDQLLEKLIDARKNAERRLQAEEPELRKAISRIYSANQRLNKELAANKILIDKLDSKNTYLAYLLGMFKDEDGADIELNRVMQIRKFYHHEYEVLPVWYKRFGHIIKVLMGKRKFRSLFKDDRVDQ